MARVLIIPDKFKGTLTAQEAALAIRNGWLSVKPKDHCILLPMSDGGDGFGAVMGQLFNAQTIATHTVDAAHRPLDAQWWWEPTSKTAIIETARIIGLAMLPNAKFHPFDLDTWGVGAVIKDAKERGAQRCYVGIGGSATNDAGFGMARSLDWQFLSRHGKTIEQWTDLHALNKISPPRRKKWFAQMIVAVDVKNRLLGKYGATRVYGPQKGLKPSDFPLAERCFTRLRAVAKTLFGSDFATCPGSGAAGGLGFGLRAFCGARFQGGFELFAHCAKLNSILTDVDIVITGEGALDRSTLMGKGVGEVARLSKKRSVRCLGIAGIINDRSELSSHFDNLQALAPDLTDPESAKKQPAEWLTQAAIRMSNLV